MSVIYLSKAIQQGSDGLPLVKVYTIINAILSDDPKLPTACGDASLDLLDYLLHGMGVMTACDERDGAIRAGVAASLGDLDVAVVSRRDARQRRSVGQRRSAVCTERWS